METVNSRSYRRLSTASAPKSAKKAVPSPSYVILRMYYGQMVVFISSFQLYYIDTHMYLSFNVPHLIEKLKTFFVVLMINVP